MPRARKSRPRQKSAQHFPVTLNTLDQVTAQEVFNHVVRGLKAQKYKQSLNCPDGSFCAYRGTDGRKCAAGLCMTDAEKAAIERWKGASIEGQNWYGLYLNDLVPAHHYKLIKDLQSAHDCGSLPSMMIRELTEVAANHRLSPVVLKEAA